MPHFDPITRDGLVELITDRIRELGGRVLIAIDGADAAEPVTAADHISTALRDTGRAAEVVSLHDYIRPASLRMEFGRTDEMSYRTAWFDYAALDREVIRALRDDARWLAALWDEDRDRSARSPIRTAAPGTVLLIAGPMLLGRGLDFDLSVHLDMSEPALYRRTPPVDRWTIPALLRHDRDNPSAPTFFIRWDHPDRPALRIDDIARR
ncbi:hypothetical protein AB0L63_15445 [Nocardia sp. NPDC051990]|uniref:hypothetical protein n=1 Tax=Nocardia sp. NPDC051990 TaxID=3155285 RepID=UPI00341C57E3